MFNESIKFKNFCTVNIVYNNSWMATVAGVFKLQKNYTSKLK